MFGDLYFGREAVLERFVSGHRFSDAVEFVIVKGFSRCGSLVDTAAKAFL
jgi:hypothetical protein